MDWTLFLEQRYASASETSIKSVWRVLANIDAKLNGRDIKEAVKDPDFLCSVFYADSNTKMSVSSYGNTKSVLEQIFSFYDILAKVPDIEVVIEYSNCVFYYRDINDALSYVDAVGQYIINDYNPETDLIIEKVLVILSWRGLSYREMALLKTECTLFIDESNYSILVGDKNVSISKMEYQIIQKMKTMQTRKRIMGGNSYPMYDHEFLFGRPFGVTPSETTLKNRFRLLNSKIEERTPLKRKFKASALHDCYIFSEVYSSVGDTQQSSVVVTKLGELTGCNRKHSWDKLKHYRIWHKKFNQQEGII